MERPSKVHCFFEQSGTFKREFIKIGIPAEDYDIQNHFGETDHVIDLFAEIEAAYDGRASVFDGIGGGDLIMAFFPCIMFCGISQSNMTLARWIENHGSVNGAGAYILARSQKRQQFLELLLKLCFTCIDRKIKMIFENPYSTNTYLKNGFIKLPDIIDNNRMERGDYFTKPTGYWFFNCEPCRLKTRQMTPPDKRKYILMHPDQYAKHRALCHTIVENNSKTGICSEERSMISPDYARNFIADFILGVPLSTSAYQQGELPLGLEAET